MGNIKKHSLILLSTLIVIFSIFFIGISQAFALTQGTWSVSSTGEILSIEPQLNDGTRRFEGVASDIDFTTACTGTGGGLQDVNTYNWIGVNLITDWALGSNECAGEGTYYLLVSEIGNYNTVDYYWEVNYTGSGIGPVATSTGTRIVSLNTPTAGEVTTDISVDFDIDFVSNYPVPSEICINLTNLSLGQNVVPICETITQSGILNFATTTTLEYADVYRYQVAIYDSENNIIDITTSNRYFTVEFARQSPWDPEGNAGTSSTTTIDQLTLECDESDPFWERSICNLAVLLFVPDSTSLTQLDNSLASLMERQPFSAVNEFKTGWDTATKNPDVEYSSLSLEFYGEDVRIISTTSLYAIAGSSGINNLRGLMAIILWILFGWVIFQRVTKLF